jgi:putative PIN family toxin of toxin-antitoxin system
VKVVLDTNVLVSGLLNPNGPPGTILNLTLHGRLTPHYDHRILVEYQNVLHRKKFGFSKELVQDILDYIQLKGVPVSSIPIQEPFSDEADKKFLEVARGGEVRFLITGNIKDFPENEARVVSPKDFLNHIQK